MQSTEAVPQPTYLHDPDGSCELLLIRNGRSADVVPGSPEAADPGLHAEGERQVAALSARLSSKRIDAVYASHLARAMRTAEALARPRTLEVNVDADLREVELGDWSNGEFRRRAALADPEWVAWSQTGRWAGIPGGETDERLRRRVVAVVDALAERHVGGTIAVVAHGGAINAYIAEIFGAHRTIVATIENTSITVVRVSQYGHILVTVNDCHHLYDPVLDPS